MDLRVQIVPRPVVSLEVGWRMLAAAMFGPGITELARPRLPSSAAELRWAIDELQSGLGWCGPCPPGGLETHPDCQPKGSGGLGRPHPSCPQRVDLLGALAEEGRNQEPARRASAIRAARGKAPAVLLARLHASDGQRAEPLG